MHWNVDPIAFEIGPLSVRWYGLLFASGFYMGFLAMQRIYRAEKVPLPYLDKLLIYMVIGTVVGARLGHTLFYEPEVYLPQPWRILKVWEGGLASHGALIGVLISVFLYSKKYGLPYLWVLDRVGIAAALASVFIRTGNFFNSEILGRPSDLPWAVVFERVDTTPRHPAQLYEAFAYILIFLLINRLYWKTNLSRRRGFLFGLMLTLTFGVRFFIEFVKANQVAFESQLPLNMGQLLSIPVVLGSILLMLRALKSPMAPPVADGGLFRKRESPTPSRSSTKKKKRKRH